MIFTTLARLQCNHGIRAGHLFLITYLFASYNLHAFILKQVIFIFMQFICWLIGRFKLNFEIEAEIELLFNILCTYTDFLSTINSCSQVINNAFSPSSISEQLSCLIQAQELWRCVWIFLEWTDWLSELQKLQIATDYASRSRLSSGDCVIRC